MSVLVILGSSRLESNTLKAVKALIPFPRYDLIDLNQKKIGYYDYDPSRVGGDDFVSVAEQMLQYEVIVFATPVYWYTMSGQMKVFFDRMTELTAQYKPWGKALKGKKVYLVACGASPDLPPEFDMPFRRTSQYFQMEFMQTFYARI